MKRVYDVKKLRRLLTDRYEDAEVSRDEARRYADRLIKRADEECAFDLKAWIQKKIKESKASYDEAEKDRDESSYTDIDALEQSCYNDGILDALEELKEALR